MQTACDMQLRRHGRDAHELSEKLAAQKTRCNKAIIEGALWTLRCSSQRMGCGASSESKYAGHCGDKVVGLMSIIALEPKPLNL